MRRIKSLVWLLLLLSCLPAFGQEKIVPCPPEYIQGKQLPGEDPFDISKPVFSPDSKYVAAFCHTTRKLTVWDLANATVAAEIGDDVHKLDACDGIEFTNDGKQLILLRNFQPITWLDWRAGKVTRTIDAQADPKKILSYAFSPDQNLLALGTYTGIQLWDLKSGKKVTDYMKGQAISGLDMLIYKDKKGKLVRLLAYGRALLPPDLKWHNCAGILDMDSGKHTNLLDDIPADKKVDGNMTFFWVSWENGGGHLVCCYSSFPPKVKAGMYLLDSYGKYQSNTELGQFVIKDRTPWYLWKPFYGFSVVTADMSQPASPYKDATQFLVPTREGKLVVLDTITEAILPIFGIRYNRDYSWAAVVLKKDAQDTAKLFLYKVVPKKK